MEAPEDLQKIHQHVASMMTVLKRADRANNLQYEKEKEAAALQIKEMEQRLEQANEAIRRAETEAERLREEAAARDQVLKDIGWVPGGVAT